MSGLPPPPALPDALSEVLRAVRLTGALFYNVHAQSPWVAEAHPAGVIYPQFLPRADHYIEYHVIAEGSCWGGLRDGPQLELHAGDVICFPQGDGHVLSSQKNLRQSGGVRPDLQPPTMTFPLDVRIGGDGEKTRLVCGFLACDARPFNPLLENLPRIIHTRGAGLQTDWLHSVSQLALTETRAKRVGRDSVLSRLSELMFLEVVRRYLESIPPTATGWLAGVRDPLIGRALSLLHASPTEEWSLVRLARGVGASRSVLAERFTQLIGMPPMQYLAQWRMQLAATRLVATTDTVASVAFDTGYNSEAAFSRAFKKSLGQSPANWRRERTVTVQETAQAG